jgi:hypothetical protein
LWQKAAADVCSGRPTGFRLDRIQDRDIHELDQMIDEGSREFIAAAGIEASACSDALQMSVREVRHFLRAN